MNFAAKSAIHNNLLLHQCSSSSSFHLRAAAALFHSSPVLERKRRGSSYSGYSRPNFSSRRNRKLHGKDDLLRNLRAYADTLFQGWKDEHEEEGPSANKEPSWFRKQYSKGPKNTNARSSRWDKRGFDFCEDDVEVETIFRSAFGGSSRHFYWSFINDEQPQWKRSSSWHSRRFRFREEDESDSESDSIPVVDLVSERRTLGLHPSGPLKLEDVKSAYRTCAMKWHPDRHLGSSKAVAEEKFKVCSAAYETLCTKLATAAA